LRWRGLRGGGIKPGEAGTLKEWYSANLGAPRRKRKERALWGSTGRKSFLPRKWLNANDVDGLKEGWIVDLDKGRSHLRDCNAAAFERKAIDRERRKRKPNAKMVKPDCDR
jgi:hypothetical protein